MDDFEDADMMVLTITKPFANHGSIIQFVGVDDDGNEYVVAVDHRPAYAVIEALEFGEEVRATVEPWQISRLPRGWGVG